MCTEQLTTTTAFKCSTQLWRLDATFGTQPVGSSDRRYWLYICAEVELISLSARIVDIYGVDGYSERLIGKTIKDRRKDVFLATKFAFDIKKGGVNGTPEYVRSACAASLERLGTDYIDLYYMHRIDPKV